MYQSLSCNSRQTPSIFHQSTTSFLSVLMDNKPWSDSPNRTARHPFLLVCCGTSELWVGQIIRSKSLINASWNYAPPSFRRCPDGPTAQQALRHLWLRYRQQRISRIMQQCMRLQVSLRSVRYKNISGKVEYELAYVAQICVRRINLWCIVFVQRHAPEAVVLRLPSCVQLFPKLI